MTTPEVIEAAKNGDTRAFALIVESYRQNMFRLCARILCDSSEAEDTVQDAFVSAWQALPGFNPEYSMSTWLGAIACRQCYDVLRRRKRQRRYEQEALRQRGGDCALDPESDVAGRDLEIRFRKVTSTLAPMQRTVFVLAEIEGLPFEEIRRITGWSSVQIKSNLYIARQKVRKALEKEL